MSSEPIDVGAEYVPARRQLQAYIRELQDSAERGLAVDMAIAAERLEKTTAVLAVSVRYLFACKVSLDAQVRSAAYECNALRELIANLFAACLQGTEPSDPGDDRAAAQPAIERYPRLRGDLAECAARIDQLFLEFP
jgi:hypothetical protein